MSCISAATSTVGYFTINTNGCNNFGTGYYLLQCATHSGNTTTNSDTITITINDVCYIPNVITSLIYSNLSYM